MLHRSADPSPEASQAITENAPSVPRPTAEQGSTPARQAPHARTALALGSFGFFLITLDLLIVNLALPQIGQQLGGGATGRQWVIDGYTLLFAALLLFAGNLADRIGAKWSLGIGTALFLIASIGCAAAPSLPLLIAARVLQGGGAAVMLPATMSLIREAYPDPAARARALGIWATGGAVAATVGPLAGGALTTLDWRLIFAINLPVCAVMLVLLTRLPTSPTHATRFDVPGQITALVALGSLVGALIEGGSLGYGSSAVIAGFVIAVAAGIVFVSIQKRSDHPMMPLGLFASIGVRIALALGFAFMVANFGTVYLVSLHLQQHLHLTPLLTGLLFLPSAFCSIAGNLLSGRATNRYGTRFPVIVGMTTMAVGVFGMVAVAPLQSPLPIAGMLLLTGFGGAFAMPPVSGLVLASAPARLAGTASAVFNTFRQIGGAIAIAVFGALAAAPGGFVSGLQISLTVTGLLLVTAAGMAAVGIRRADQT